MSFAIARATFQKAERAVSDPAITALTQGLAQLASALERELEDIKRQLAEAKAAARRRS